MSEITKICSQCKQHKPIEKFRIRADRKKENAFCIDCERRKAREYYLSLKGQKAHKKTYKKYKKNGTWKNDRLKSKYNLTLKQHQQMYLEQNGCCGICGCSIPYNKVQTDHNHKTGKVRELLCGVCNPFAGYIEKYPERLDKIIKYLEKHNEYL